MNLGSACCHAPGEFRLVNTTTLHLGANLLDHNPHQRPGGDFFVNALFFEEVIKARSPHLYKKPTARAGFREALAYDFAEMWF